MDEVKFYEHDGCAGCAFTDKRCDEYPCCSCRGTISTASPKYTTTADFWRSEGERDNLSNKPSNNAEIRPNHYKTGGIECIEAIKAAMSAEEYKGFLRGNVLKYVWRYKEKGGARDLRKAAQYLEWLEAEEEKEHHE